MTREQRRLVDNMRETVADFGAAARARDDFAGGMQWLKSKEREYLTRYRRDPVSGEQRAVSLGRRSAETEGMYDAFIKGRDEIDASLSVLRPVMAEQGRMAKALRLSRAPSEVGDVMRAIGLSPMFDHVTLVGEAAVFAYECEMAALLPREMLPDDGLDLLIAGVHPTDAIDEIAGVLRRAKITVTGGRDLDRPELRTDEGTPIRLLTQSMIDRMADYLADEDAGGGEAARWALDQSPIRSLVIDRQGRVAPVSVPEPRAWCILRCMMLDLRDLSATRRETSSEVVSAVIRLVQERWPEPFEPDQVESYGRLYQAIEGDEFLPPPRY